MDEEKAAKQTMIVPESGNQRHRNNTVTIQEQHMKVLLTGSFGNIGEKTIHELLRQNHDVLCLDLKNPNNEKVARQFGNKIDIIWGDITNAQQVAEAVTKVDVVIHMAAMLPATVDKNPELGQRVNVGGTQNIVDAIKASGGDKQLIFCSSISVHGNNTPDGPHPRKIGDPFQADDAYAGHKIECEKLIDASGVKATIVRIGACMDADSDIGGDPKDALKLIFATHPDCRIEYIHPKDVALAIVNAVGNEAAYNKKFFLGAGKNGQRSWYDFTDIIFKALGLKKPPRDAFGDQAFYTEYMDTEEAQKVLRYQRYTLEDYQREMSHKLRFARLAILPVRPLVRYFLIAQSPNR